MTPRWPGAGEPMPEICVEVEPGDSLHRVALCNAAQVLLIDAATGTRPPQWLITWAFAVFACIGRVPEA